MRRELNDTSDATERPAFIETSLIRVVVPVTNNLLFKAVSLATDNLELNATSLMTLSFELKDASEPTDNSALIETSPKIEVLYPIFDKITFLSMLVVSDRLYLYSVNLVRTSISDASIISTLVFVTI